MTTKTIVKVGEYEVSHDCGAHFVAHRNGHLWRDLTGDNLVLALVQRIQQLEEAFTTPTTDMVQAGLAEVQRMLDEWDDDGHIQLGHGNDPVSYDQAADMAVLVIQAMVTKLPKAGE